MFENPRRMSEKVEEDEIVEIQALCEIDILLINGQISESHEEEKLRQLGKITCSDQESNRDQYDCIQKRNSETITERILGVLISLKKPMTVPEIWEALSEKEGSKKISLAGLRGNIGYLYKSEKIKRIAPGIYACLEFDDKNYEPPKKLGESMIEILDTAGQPMDIKQIVGRLNESDSKKFGAKQIRDHLGSLYRRGKIKRLAEGVYAGLEFDDENYEPPKKLGELIVEILDTAGQPMSIRGVLHRLNENATRQARLESTRVSLRVMHKRGKIKRLAEGVYAGLEFDDENYEPPKKLGELIVEILDTAGQPMKNKEVMICLDELDSKRTNNQEVCNQLTQLFELGEIQRLTKGIYACLGFDSREYEAPKTLSERVLEFLETCDKPMSLEVIVENFNKTNHEKLDPNKVKNAMRNLYQTKKIKRLAEGVYACLGFEGQSEIEKVIPQSTKTRREKTTLPVRASKSSTAANRKRSKAPRMAQNNSYSQADKDQYDVLLQQKGKQRTLTVGGRIGKITRSWVGPMTVEGIIEALNKDGFRKVNPETARSLVEIRLRREKERLEMSKGRV